MRMFNAHAGDLFDHSISIMICTIHVRWLADLQICQCLLTTSFDWIVCACDCWPPSRRVLLQQTITPWCLGVCSTMQHFQSSGMQQMLKSDQSRLHVIYRERGGWAWYEGLSFACKQIAPTSGVGYHSPLLVAWRECQCILSKLDQTLYTYVLYIAIGVRILSGFHAAQQNQITAVALTVSIDLIIQVFVMWAWTCRAVWNEFLPSWSTVSKSDSVSGAKALILDIDCETV